MATGRKAMGNGYGDARLSCDVYDTTDISFFFKKLLDMDFTWHGLLICIPSFFHFQPGKEGTNEVTAWQSGASYRLRGFEDNVLGSSPDWLADAAWNYC